VAARETQRRGIVLIFDEVISFRVAWGGAQEHFGVRPDLTTLGKIIGGGLPVGAFGGRRDIMAYYDPRQGAARISQGGTFNANPVTMAAGLATLNALTPEGVRAARRARRAAARRRLAPADGHASQGTGERRRLALLAALDDGEADRLSLGAAQGRGDALRVFHGARERGHPHDAAWPRRHRAGHQRRGRDRFVNALARVVARQ